MARPRKGEIKLGKVMKCDSCSLEEYRSPSRSNDSGLFKCMECRISKAFSFNCVSCGKKVMTQPSQIRLRHRSSCSKDCRFDNLKKIVAERRKGYSKHQLDRLARYSKEADIWRKSVFDRDDYTCQMCGERGGYLEADHIKPWAYFPDLRFDLDNGRTLCRACHNTTKISAKRMREIYG